MKVELVLCYLVVFCVSVSDAQASLKNLQGVWTGTMSAVDIAIVTEQGVELVCMNTLPLECREELPNGLVTAVIQDNHISLDIVFREGVTIENSPTHFPICAAAGVIVFEARAVVPESRINFYDATTGYLTFIDPRRPDDINCAIVSIGAGEEGPHLRVKSVMRSIAATMSEMAEAGPSLRCVAYNDLCVISTNEDRLTFFLDLDFEIPCASGACLNSE